MGLQSAPEVIMQLLILSCLAATSFGQLIHHPNGAVTPIDHANFAATANHLAAKGYYGYGHFYGKREAEADAQLITYTNGAVVPVDHANIAATNAHILSKGVVAYPYAYGVHPFLVGHPNGAVVPVEPYDVVKARADHLAAKAAAV
eukprot:TRINITY_DN694_c0_g1_i5.p1 TRINITY_DN694_c0_g1~~TRINITY_DN694_c0_g1_i5.p1  ORF type:complete len:146 (-),score=55.47 TRINITY_DN694_c0_g1_i5:98-535(-)